MTDDPYIEIMEDGLRTLAEGVDSLRDAVDELSEKAPFTALQMREMSRSEKFVTSAFLKRFEQLEDITARMMRTALQAAGTDTGNLQNADIGRRLERLGIIADNRAWRRVVDRRNLLAHEYPNAHEKRAQRFNGAWELADVLFTTAEAVSKELQKRLAERKSDD